ncbi:hypothetical protein SAMN05216456_2185 [Devosia crocina]|uniref:Uncharacterized protein n=1 Tax=Devosia crocina TaxID=429728 RepID=A0A1I7NLT4_9HYPH|nr:hypothetical protein [Devosia crocina]SFV35593.1 hypothetical protein SAMN05216456_2185 [Devosia crocina]
MATVVRLSEEQIEQLLADADAMERTFKDMHEELARLDTPKDTLARFGKLHDRFSSVLEFLRRQRELGR